MLSIRVTNTLLTILVILSANMAANAAPKSLPAPPDVFKRAAGLDNGINISWLEHTWDKHVLDSSAIKPSDFQLLKQLGFKSIRLPVAFEYFNSDESSMRKVLGYLDQVLKSCRLYGFKLIICYHFGNLNDNNYLTESQAVISLWQKLAKRYLRESGENLFFDIFNEPPHMNPDLWKNVATSIISGIRQVDQNRTLIVGASNYNSIYEMSRMTPFSDDNLIYAFHFYEPFFFTHQGAEWVGGQVSTIEVPFPYDASRWPPLNPKAKGTAGEAHYDMYPRDGNEQSVHDKLQIVKNWAAQYNVPLLCGEYGVYKKYADLESRCRYIKAVRQNLKAMGIPGIMWDYNTNFSLFEGKPSITDLPDCMKDALNYNAQK